MVLNRPSRVTTPPALLSLLMGEAAEILTTGQRVFPAKAVELGYEFRHARLVPALESILAPS
jgi:NAD dependent epimerase/dehydratase family enzyme